MASEQAKQDDVNSVETTSLVQQSASDEAQPLEVTPQAAFAAELQRLHQKAFNKETFTRQEKITLLKTRFLPYKALAAPDKLTLEERYRMLMRPPPEEVKESILRLTKGVYSTPEELLQRAVEDAESLSTEVLMFMGRSFIELDGMYDSGRHMTWANKWREAGEAALEYISTDLDGDGIRQALKVLWVTGGRDEEKSRTRDERHAAILALGGDEKGRERADEKSRWWEAHDQKLLREAAALMDGLLEELLRRCFRMCADMGSSIWATSEW